MRNEEMYKLNDIIVGLTKTIERYKHYLFKKIGNTEALAQTALGQNILKLLNNNNLNVPSDDNPLSNIFRCQNNESGLMLKYDLKKFENFFKENKDIIDFFDKNPDIKLMSKYTDEQNWISQCLIVNIDTYINMFFKLMFNIEYEQDLPRGFNDKPKENFYTKFPILKGKLDYEFFYYQELHSIRNNIIHNGTIVDNKLLNKLAINNSCNDGIAVFIPNFEKIILYALSCLEIIVVANNEFIKNIYLTKDIEQREISHFLTKYREFKEKYPTN